MSSHNRHISPTNRARRTYMPNSEHVHIKLGSLLDYSLHGVCHELCRSLSRAVAAFKCSCTLQLKPTPAHVFTPK